MVGGHGMVIRRARADDDGDKGRAGNLFDGEEST